MIVLSSLKTMKAIKVEECKNKSPFLLLLLSYDPGKIIPAFVRFFREEIIKGYDI
jgi:hypothetical protein